MAFSGMPRLPKQVCSFLRGCRRPFSEVPDYLRLLNGGLFSGSGDQKHARENQQDGKGFHPAEVVHPPQHRYGRGNHRLAVVVHADRGGFQPLLCEGQADVAYKGSECHHVGNAQPRLHGKCGITDGNHVPEGEGQAGDGGVGEHPFHQGDGRVSADQVFKEDEVNGYAALGGQAKDVPQQVVVSRQGRRTPSAAGNQQNGSDGAGADPDDFFSRDHFPEDEGRQNHGQYRRNGGDDGRIRRRGESHAHREGHLVENDAEQGGVKQGQPVLPCNGFPGHEGGGQPEQDGRSQQAEGSQGSGADFPRLHDQFADRRHEAPDNGRRSHRDMSLQGSGFHGTARCAAGNAFSASADGLQEFLARNRSPGENGQAGRGACSSGELGRYGSPVFSP